MDIKYEGRIYRTSIWLWGSRTKEMASPRGGGKENSGEKQKITPSKQNLKNMLFRVSDLNRNEATSHLKNCP
jgi:hypothetical protein